MAFLDAADAGDQGGGAAAPPTPQGPPGGGAPGGGAPGGGGQILAALANRQRGPQVSAPGAGDQANSMSMIQQAIAMLQQALPGLQPGSPIQQDVLKGVQRLSRHVAQGQPTAGLQQTQLRDLLQNVIKNALLSRIMGQQGQGRPGGGGGAGGGAGGGGGPPGAMAQAPPPSTPLPGA